FGAFVGGRSLRTSLQAGLGLAPIGELSFAIALLCLTLHLITPQLFPILVGITLVASMLVPPLLALAGRLVDWLGRAAPGLLLNCLNLYTRWVGQLVTQGSNSATNRLVRRWLGQMALNVGLIGVIFIAATCLDEPRPNWLKHLGLRDEPLRAALWLVAVVL